jgi:hypothetical protein
MGPDERLVGTSANGLPIVQGIDNQQYELRFAQPEESDQTGSVGVIQPEAEPAEPAEITEPTESNIIAKTSRTEIGTDLSATPLFRDEGKEEPDQSAANRPELPDDLSQIEVAHVSATELVLRPRRSWIERHRRKIQIAEAVAGLVLLVGYWNEAYDRAGGTDGTRFIDYAHPSELLAQPIDDAKAIGEVANKVSEVVGVLR